MALNGTETLQVLGIAANGFPAASTQETTTAAIAALASSSTSPATSNTNITTVGAGSLTAAAVAGGLITRSGPVAAFSDTFATASAIIAARPAYVANSSWNLRIKNTTNFVQTIVTNTGITLTGQVIIPANAVGNFLVTMTGASTLSIVGINNSNITAIPNAQFNTGTTTTTFAAGQLCGSNMVVYTNTQATPGSIATRTATQIVAAIDNCYTGFSYFLRVVNGQGTGTLTITAGTDVTLTGTMTVVANTYRDFIVTVTNAATPAVTFQNIGIGTFS